MERSHRCGAQPVTDRRLAPPGGRATATVPFESPEGLKSVPSRVQVPAAKVLPQTGTHPGSTTVTRILYRLGLGAAAHPWRTISAWLVVVVVALGLAAVGGGTPKDDYDVPDARAQVGVDQLREHLPGGGGATAQVVVHDTTGTPLDGGDLDALLRRLEGIDHVSFVSPPRVSADGDTALVNLQYDVPTTDPDLVARRATARSRTPSSRSATPASRPSSAVSCPGRPSPR